MTELTTMMENMATEVKEMRKENYVYKKQIDKRKSEPKRRSKGNATEIRESINGLGNMSKIKQEKQCNHQRLRNKHEYHRKFERDHRGIYKKRNCRQKRG